MKAHIIFTKAKRKQKSKLFTWLLLFLLKLLYKVLIECSCSIQITKELGFKVQGKMFKVLTMFVILLFSFDQKKSHLSPLHCRKKKSC